MIIVLPYSVTGGFNLGSPEKFEETKDSKRSTEYYLFNFYKQNVVFVISNMLFIQNKVPLYKKKIIYILERGSHHIWGSLA